MDFKTTLQANADRESLLDSHPGFCMLPPMFEATKAQLTTAAAKLVHLRRFL